MKLLPEIIKIIDLKSLNNNNQKKINNKNDKYFIDKYKNNISIDCDGFCFGNILIPEWCDIIDDILELCIDSDADFEINQIKFKLGGIRFYVNSYLIEDINDISKLIEDRLYNENLMN